ncbi:hypothetical protein MMC07_000556 [Pseudocyphellaria aurata]|nr:hypothetical protein [Pseudocyphellaria aurata]
MRSPAFCQHHPYGCPHGRFDRSYRRCGREHHRIAGPTQSLGNWLDGRPNPEPDPASIRVLKNPSAQPACSNLHLSTEEAFGQAHQAMSKYQRSNFACLAPGKRNVYSTLELPFKVFDQLDREMFRSVLKGNVYMKWSDKMPDGIYSTTQKAGSSKRPRITIILSRHLSEAPRADILCTLVHQMMHAYFLQCCGYKGQDGGRDGHDLCHGPEFQALLVTISNRCSLAGPRHSTTNLATLPIHPSSRRISAKLGSPRSNWSNCYAAVYTRPRSTQTDDRNWRDMAIAKARSLTDKPKTPPVQKSDFSQLFKYLGPAAVPDVPKPRSPRPSKEDQNIYFIDLATSTISTPQPRAKYSLPPESYIELLFGSQAFPLPRNLITPHIPELTKSPSFIEKHILRLPSWSEQTDLVILYAFLLGTSTSPSSPSSPIYPIISPYSPSSTSTPVVKSFISIYHLAVAFEFRPLARYAMETLHSLPYMRENPISVLEKIYHPPGSLPQVPELRTWAKKWLAQRADRREASDQREAYRREGAEGWEGADRREGAEGWDYPTNLHVLKNHPQWKAAYATLRQRGTVLVTDLDDVEAEIALKHPPVSGHYEDWPRKEPSYPPQAPWPLKPPPVSGHSNPFPFLFQAQSAAPAPHASASADAQEEKWRGEEEIRKRDEARRKREGAKTDDWEELMRLKKHPV